MQQLQGAIYDALTVIVPVVALVITAALYAAAAYLFRLSKHIQQTTLQQAVQNAIVEATMVSTDGVRATAQKWVDDVKASRADGKLTDEEKKRALDDAKSYFVNHMSKNSLSILESAFGPVEDWLGDFIEARLAELKEQGPKASSGPANRA